MQQIILLMRPFHFRSACYSKDNETHSSVLRTLGKPELRRGVSLHRGDHSNVKKNNNIF